MSEANSNWIAKKLYKASLHVDYQLKLHGGNFEATAESTVKSGKAEVVRSLADLADLSFLSDTKDWRRRALWIGLNIGLEYRNAMFANHQQKAIDKAHLLPRIRTIKAAYSEGSEPTYSVEDLIHRAADNPFGQNVRTTLSPDTKEYTADVLTDGSVAQLEANGIYLDGLSYIAQDGITELARITSATPKEYQNIWAKRDLKAMLRVISQSNTIQLPAVLTPEILSPIDPQEQ